MIHFVSIIIVLYFVDDQVNQAHFTSLHWTTKGYPPIASMFAHIIRSNKRRNSLWLG